MCRENSLEIRSTLNPVVSPWPRQAFIYQIFAFSFFFHLRVNCLSPFWSPKPLPQTSLVFNWRWYCCYCCSVTKSRLTLWDPMDCSTPGFLHLHYLPELAQTHVHWVHDAIQPSLPSVIPFSPLPDIFSSIRVFSNESALHNRWPKYWSFSFSISPSNEYSGLISFRIDWLDLAVQGTRIKIVLRFISGFGHFGELLSFPGSLPGRRVMKLWLSPINLLRIRVSLVAQWYRTCLPMQETQVRSLGWEVPLEKGMATHSCILVWESHGQRSLWATVHGVAKESDTTEQLMLFTFMSIYFLDQAEEPRRVEENVFLSDNG